MFGIVYTIPSNEVILDLLNYNKFWVKAQLGLDYLDCHSYNFFGL
jgi:hypothetical protein